MNRTNTRDSEEIEVNVDDLLDVVNAQRQENKEQATIRRGKLIRKTIDDYYVSVDIHDLLSLGAKPQAIFDVIRQR